MGVAFPLARLGGFAVYAVLMAVSIVVPCPDAGPARFVLYTLGVTALLLLVRWWKGEPLAVGWGLIRRSAELTAQIRASPLLQQGDKFRLHERVIVGNIEADYPLPPEMRAEAP